jgi:hypothetical protein
MQILLRFDCNSKTLCRVRCLVCQHHKIFLTVNFTTCQSGPEFILYTPAFKFCDAFCKVLICQLLFASDNSCSQSHLSQRRLTIETCQTQHGTLPRQSVKPRVANNRSALSLAVSMPLRDTSFLVVQAHRCRRQYIHISIMACPLSHGVQSDAAFRGTCAAAKSTAPQTCHLPAAMLNFR